MSVSDSEVAAGIYHPYFLDVIPYIINNFIGFVRPSLPVFTHKFKSAKVRFHFDPCWDLSYYNMKEDLRYGRKAVVEVDD